MRFRHKSPLQRMLETASNSLHAVSDMKPGLPAMGSGDARRTGLIAAGSLAGLTAGSAVISSFRRRSERAQDDS
jgi:hypothetical protein